MVSGAEVSPQKRQVGTTPFVKLESSIFSDGHSSNLEAIRQNQGHLWRSAGKWQGRPWKGQFKTGFGITGTVKILFCTLQWTQMVKEEIWPLQTCTPLHSAVFMSLCFFSSPTNTHTHSSYSITQIASLRPRSVSFCYGGMAHVCKHVTHPRKHKHTRTWTIALQSLSVALR